MRDDCEFAPIALLTLGKSASVWEWASRVNASPYERLICERLAGLREIVMGSCLIGPCGVPPRLRGVSPKRVRPRPRWVVGGRDAGRERPQHRRRAVMDDVLSGRDGLIRHYSSPSERLRNCWSYPLLTVSGSSLTARRPSISSLCMRFLPWSLLSRVLP